MRRFTWVLSGLCLAIIGLYMLFNPLITLNSIAVFIGIIILAQGITGITKFSSYEDKKDKGWDLFSSIISVILGAIIAFSPANLVLTAMLPFALGIWVLMKGIMQCAGSIYLNRSGSEIWGYALTFGILNILLGVLMIANPLIPAFTIVFMASLILIVTGFSSMCISM